VSADEVGPIEVRFAKSGALHVRVAEVGSFHVPKCELGSFQAHVVKVSPLNCPRTLLASTVCRVVEDPLLRLTRSPPRARPTQCHPSVLAAVKELQ
jgi:hypothetical protein